MNYAKYYLFLAASVLFSLYSCHAPLQEPESAPDDKVGRSLIETNKYMRERHREYIIAFKNRVGWEMTETSTGLWYMIVETGDGPPVQRDKLVSYAFETRLINGEICYSADTTDPKTIVVGKGNIEADLEEGLLLLREGSTARFIMPPYLAHGNFGDMKCIPGSAILITELQVTEVKR
jgi:FKBP-type peptidyl-prolyl cis-trans isomerase